MNKTIITVSSVTYAMKLKKQLERSGVFSEVIKVDSRRTDKGCTYGVRLDSRYIYDAVNVLKKYGINYSVITDI